jgi:hypothetical protein
MDSTISSVLLVSMLATARGFTATVARCGAMSSRALDKIGVQVKYFQGVDNSLKGLSQLEQAFQAHQLAAGLLVSFADQLGDELLKKKLEEMKKTLNVEVLYGENLYQRLLSLVIGSDPLAD